MKEWFVIADEFACDNEKERCVYTHAINSHFISKRCTTHDIMYMKENPNNKGLKYERN